MKPLTLYIMVADKNHLPLHIITDSVGDMVETYVLFDHRNLAEFAKDCKTDWYMYLFDNEYLSKELTDALPVLMESDFDVWVMFEKQNIGDGKYRYGRSPRLFKKGVELKGMVPLKLNELLVEKVLDGFVEQGNAKV